ncbi:N-acetylmuramoyl-L-alanine amidase [Microbulbifer sp. JMSA002]|uniref:N-acetylmuramoyl-L-alanine amidase n=1 Tax=Microbulbifer sp. JMSA002 TaxID=3243368 RepID=UPI004039772A
MFGKRKVTKAILVDATFTPNTEDKSAWDIEGIDRSKGALGIKSHYIIRRNGDVEKGRGIDEVCCTGQHQVDKESILILLVGTDKFTKAQVGAVNGLVEYLQDKFPEAGPAFMVDVDEPESTSY